MKKFLITILFCFLTTNCFAAQFLYKTVEEDGNGDYTTLEACTGANEQDLTGDGWFDVEIIGTELGGNGWTSADTTRLLLHNYVTTPDDYINIYTSPTARHKGVYSTSYYRLDSASTIIFYFGNVFVNGIQNDSTTTLASAGGNTVFRNCLITHSFSDGAGAGNQIFVNCIFLSGSYIDHTGVGSSVYIYNCTFIGGRFICRANTTNFCTNFLIDHTDAFLVYAGATLVATNCSLKENKSSDWTTDGGGNRINQTFTFVGDPDFHLDSGDAGALDYGTSLVADGVYPFSDDIDGETRTGTWDIGADEYVSAVEARRIMVISQLNIKKK